MIKSIASPLQAPVAPGVLCVILDAGLVPDLQTRIEQLIGSGTERSVGLFDNTPYAALQSAGPFALLCPLPSELMSYAITLLERTSAGCIGYLENQASFDQAIEHWRSLLTISTDDTPARLMRFYEPRWLEPLLNNLSEAEWVQFMGPFTDLAWRDMRGWRHQPHPRPHAWAALQAPGWSHIGRERQRPMEQQRLAIVADRFAQDYQQVLPMADPAAFVHRQLLAATDAGYRTLADLERWLRLSLKQGDEFWSRPASAQLLAREDLSLGDKLIELER